MSSPTFAAGRDDDPPARETRSGRRKPEAAQLSTGSRIAMGAIGGLSPIVVTLAVTDVATIQQVIVHGFAASGSVASFAGWAVKVLVLMAIGGAVAYFYETETSKLKLLQIGIAAPAILTSMVNGSNVSAKTAGAWDDAGRPEQVAQLMPPDGAAPLLVFQKQTKPSPFDCFIRGLIDRKC